jgi:lysyl-tRNA synthetase class 2
VNLERLQQRARIIKGIRDFFWERGYLEADTPALSPALIPETCLEVFRTELISPGRDERTPLFLVPSPEVYLKPLISRHRCDVFQISKCYRNGESTGRIHSPEFTMLEYYTMNADYKDSVTVTEQLFARLGAPYSFLRLTMNEAFRRFAGFSLDDCQDPLQLAAEVRRLDITEPPASPFSAWPWPDLFDLILVHCVEPALKTIPEPVLLMDYPARVPCLAKNVPAADGSGPKYKERWELYWQGMELANCYSEETDGDAVRLYIAREGALKQKSALVPHPVDSEYWRNFAEGFPPCSGVALGVDRLVALLCGSKSIEGVLP